MPAGNMAAMPLRFLDRIDRRVCFRGCLDAEFVQAGEQVVRRGGA